MRTDIYAGTIVHTHTHTQTGAIRSLLDTCLATDEEIAAAHEGKLRDELFGEWWWQFD